MLVVDLRMVEMLETMWRMLEIMREKLKKVLQMSVEYNGGNCVENVNIRL